VTVMVAPDSTRHMFAWYSGGAAKFLTPFIRYLREHYGIGTVLFVYGEALLPRDGEGGFDRSAYVEIVDVEPTLRARLPHDLPSGADLARRAADFERRVSRTVPDILRTDRHLGIGYVTNAEFHRSTYSLTTNYSQSIDIVLRLADLYQGKLEKYKPIVSYGHPGSIAPATLISLTNSLGVPMRALRHTLRGDKLAWAENQYFAPIGFQEAYASAAKRLEETVEVGGRPPVLETSLMAKKRQDDFVKEGSVRRLLYYLYYEVRRTLRRWVKHPDRVYGHYLTSHVVRHIIQQWLWHRRAMREDPVMPTLATDIPFIFFPLHVEPEATLMVESDMPGDQIAMIDWLAKGAPGGWLVLVKEHPGASSPRPPGFWRQVRAYPNVVVLSTRERAEEIVEKAAAVATISGTTGIQAAAFGTPVIAFNRRYLGCHMPHIYYSGSLHRTQELLLQIRDGDLPSQDERRRGAQAFLDAYDAVGFEISDLSMLRGGSIGALPRERDIQILAESLMQSLAVPTDHSAVGI